MLKRKIHAVVTRIRAGRIDARLMVAIALAAGITAAVATYASDGQSTQDASKPNVVMVLTDDQTYESLSKMPYTNSRSDWVRFDQAFVNNPLCCPSRATILTGQYAHHTGVQSNKEGWELRDSQTIATWLKSAGYRTAMFGKYFNDYPWDGDLNYAIPESAQKPANYVPPGWDEWAAFYKSPGYWNYTLNDNGELRPATDYNSADGRYSTYVLGDKAAQFIESQNQPFFLQLSLYAPHLNSAPAHAHENAFDGTPVEHTANHNETDVSDKPQWIRDIPEFSPTEAAELDESRRKMWRTLLAVDEVVKQVFDTLQQQGKLDNTVVLFTSDHGYVWGEHRLKHKRCVYDECGRVPLLIRAPNQPGRTVSKLVSNVDLAPTIADIAGVEPGIPVDGQSLLPLMRGQSTGWRNELLFEWRNPNKTEPDVRPPSFWAIRTDRYKYAELPETGEEELYDLQTDPDELRNEANNPAFAGIKAGLSAQLQQLKTSPGTSPSPTPGAPAPSPTPDGSPTPAPASRTLVVEVFQDNNRNGARDPGESSSMNASIDLTCGTQTIVRDQFPNGSGRLTVELPSSASGQCQVTVRPQTGYTGSTSLTRQVDVVTGTTAVQFGISAQPSVPRPPEQTNEPTPSPSPAPTDEPTEEEREGRAVDTPPPDGGTGSNLIAAPGRIFDSMSEAFKGLPKTGQAALIGLGTAGATAAAYYGLVAYHRRRRN